MDRSPALRWIVRGLIGLVALAIVAGGAVTFLLMRPSGQGFIAAKLLEAINGGDVKVDVGGTGGAWPRHIVLNNINLRDAQGVWATIDHLEARLQPAALLRGRYHVDSLAINTLHVLRLPTSTPATGPAKPFDPTGTLRTMENVLVRRAEVAVLQLDPPVAGRALDLSLNASLMPEGGIPRLKAEARQRDGMGRLSLDARADREAISGKLDGALDVYTADADVRAAYAGDIGGVVHFACTAPCLALQDVQIGSGSADIVLGGTTRRPQFNVNASAETVRAAGRTARAMRANGPVTIEDDRDRTLHVDLTGTLRDAREVFPETAAFLTETADWTLRGSRAGRTTVIEALTLKSNGNDLTGSATFTPEGIAPAEVVMNFRGDGKFGGPTAAKSVTRAELRFARALRDGTADGALHVEMKGLAPPGLMSELLATDATLDGTLAADPKGLRITDAILKSGALTVRGDSTWNGPPGRLVHQESNVVLRAEGTTPAQASLVLSGPIETVTGKLQASLADLAVAGVPAQGLTLAADGLRDGKGFSATVTGGGKWRDQPVDLLVQVTKGETPVIAIPKLHLASAAATVNGALQVDTAKDLVTGKADARFADLSILTPAVGTPLAGSGDVTVTLASPGDKQRIEASARVKDFKQKTTFTAETLTASALVEDVFGAAQVRARIDTTGGTLLERPLKTATVTASGPRDDLNVAITVTGAAKDPFNAAVAGRVALSDAIAISLARVRIADGDLVAQLQAPTQIVVSPREISLAPTRIAIAGGTVSGEVKIDRANDAAAGTVAFGKISLSDFAAQAQTLDAPNNTILDGKVTFSGPATSATVNAAFGVGFDTSDGQRGRLDLKALAQNGRAQIDGTTAGISGEPARLTADVPVRVDLAALRLISDMEAPMSGALTWHGDIAPIWRLVPVDDHVLGGPVSVDLKAEGTLASPRVRGELKMTDGTYENVPQSMVLQHVNAALTADSASSFAFTVTAADRRGGTLKGQGRVTRDDAAKAWVADISTTLEDLMALNRDDVSAALSGEATYKGPLGGGTISGKLEARRAEFRIDQTGPPPVPLLRSSQTTEEEAKNRRTGKEKARPLAIKLDLRVAIDEPMRVDGRGLNSWWRGSFVVGGTVDAPDIVGRMEVDRGNFSFISQTFTLESGTLTFTGGGRIDPEMNIVGTRETTNIVATATITGTTTAPKVELSSRPALPQDEVLARLLFQKSSTQLGPIESVQLASAAAELAGITRGGLGGALQRTFGVDQISFGGTSGSAVVVGQQVGRNLYVGVEQNLKGTGRQIVLEWRFKKGFSLRSATSDETGSDIGVSWRKDY